MGLHKLINQPIAGGVRTANEQCAKMCKTRWILVIHNMGVSENGYTLQVTMS